MATPRRASPSSGDGGASARAEDVAPPLPATPRAHLPIWRSVSLPAPALRDFAACPRRFRLLHVLAMPEPNAPAPAASPERGADAAPRVRTVADAGGRTVAVTGDVDLLSAWSDARVAAVGAAVADARLRDAFPGVPRAECDALGCGFLGLCHDG
jgi:hypothetical protein